MIQERASVPPLLRAEPVKGLGLALLAVVTLVGLCIAAKLALQTGLGWRCPVMTTFHLPCPSCGSTRAFAALSELRFLDALRFNPLLVSAIPIGIVGFFLRGFLKPCARFGWWLFGVAVVANWIYLSLFLPR
jgi:hypothetical protein